MLRRAVWAGRFYPAQPPLLHRELEACLAAARSPQAERIAAPIGCIVPHAGYAYSGGIAGAAYARMELPDRFIILCPNHTGAGAPLAIMSEGEWETPLGNARIDRALAEELRKSCRLLCEDARAHLKEHSLEVQLPFLQKLRPDFQFVPIAVGTDAFDAIELLGAGIAQAASRYAQRLLIVASSDMNHFEPDEKTRVKDRLAIEQILALDPRSLYDTIRRERISMCGYCPAAAMLIAAVRLGARSAELVRYGTSADASGDLSRVVGYAAMVVW
jgi:AmmeMemoRadiSam system protein B